MPASGPYSVSLPRSAPAPRSSSSLAASLAALLAGAALIAYAALPAHLVSKAASLSPLVPAVDAPATVAATQPLVAETSSIRTDTPPNDVVPAAPDMAPVAVTQDIATPAQVAPPPAVVAPPPAAAAPVPAVARPGSSWLAEGFIFITDGQDWDAGSYTNVEGALSRIPARIRAQLGNRDLGPVNVLVNSAGRSLSAKQPYGGPANFYSTNDGHNELVLFPNQSVLTIMHELGHSYNLRRAPAGRYALVLLEPEMQSFMAATGWRVLTTADQVRAARDQMQVNFAYDGPQVWPRLSHDDPLEDFANSFALYFFAAEELHQRSPERFAWFDANVGH